MKSAGKRYFSWASAGPYLALVLLPLLAFLPVLSAQFLLWDDDVNVTRNPGMLPSAVDPIIGWWTNLDRPYQQLYIPLTYTAWRIICSFAGLDVPQPDGIAFSPGAFHAVNLALHLANGILVYLIVRRFIQKRWPAALGALLFAVHPVQVESVAWVTGLKDVLSGSLALAALYGFVRFIDAAPRPSPPRPKNKARHLGRRWPWFALGFFAFISSMLAKPSTASVPIMAALLGCAIVALRAADDAPPAEARRIVRTTLYRVVVPLIPWFLAAIVIAVETRHSQPASLIESAPVPRPLIAVDTISFFIRLLFAPIHMSPDYGRTPAAVAVDAWRYAKWLIPPLLLLVAYLSRKRLPLLVAGMLFFMAATLPVWGLVPFDFQVYSTVADRYLYFAMLGAALAGAALVERFWQPAVAAGWAAILLALAVATFVQSRRWHDTARLFEYTLAVNPRSLLAHSKLGVLAAADHNDAEAVEHYEQAVRIRPIDYFANYNWGNLLLRETKPAEALARYREAMRSAPDDGPLHNNAGIALIQLRKTDEAIAEFKQAISSAPAFADAQSNLGQALMIEKRFGEAYTCFQRAVELDANQQYARNAMAYLDSMKVKGP